VTKLIARGISEVEGSAELIELVQERTTRHEVHLAGILEKVRYEIPSKEVMLLYFDDDHHEHVRL
jgi:hypothetical protein